MHPYLSLIFDDEIAASAAVAPLESVTAEGIGPLFRNFRRDGRTVTFALTYATDHVDEPTAMSAPMHFKKKAVTEEDFCAAADDLGLLFRPRLGGANTAYHIPEGILIVGGAGIATDSSRRQVDVLDVAPSLLANVLKVMPSPKMEGTPSLFA